MVLSQSAIAIVVLLVCFKQISVRTQSHKAGSIRRISDYSPYPKGILPSNLNSEVDRVLREIDALEGRALARWHALPPPILTGQPPVLQNTGTEAIETLGELMLFDKNISPQKNEACASCHMPYAGFSGPIPSVNLTMIAYPGTAHFRCCNSTRSRACSLVETFGICAPVDIACACLTRNRHKVLQLIPWKWVSQTPPASRFAFQRRRTVRFSKRYGAKVRSTSSFRATLQESARRRVAHLARIQLQSS